MAIWYGKTQTFAEKKHVAKKKLQQMLDSNQVPHNKFNALTI